jgi:hypothetical protein
MFINFFINLKILLNISIMLNYKIYITNSNNNYWSTLNPTFKWYNITTDRYSFEYEKR